MPLVGFSLSPSGASTSSPFLKKRDSFSLIDHLSSSYRRSAMVLRWSPMLKVIVAKKEVRQMIVALPSLFYAKKDSILFEVASIRYY